MGAKLQKTTRWRLASAVTLAGAMLACSGGSDELERTVLTPEKDRYWNPQYSPNGDKLAYGRGTSASEAIWVANADGGGAIQLSPEAMEVGQISWSPDGAWIAYNKSTSGTYYIAKIPHFWGSRGGADRGRRGIREPPNVVSKRS